ncbi:uncharacterized protein ACRADG_001973 [Cochliomyia hominivorax]
MNNGGFGYNPAGFVKNFNCLRKTCYWAGGFGLVQSLIWIGLTLTGILSYSCIISIGGTFNYGSLFGIVFIDLYFLGTCGNTIPSYNDTMLKQVHTVLNPQDIVIWDSVYLAVSVCWLLASILIMSSYLKPDQPRVVSGLLWTWILVTFCICGMDLALGIMFGIDYGRFQRKAYEYNLDSMYKGAVQPDAAQLLAGMVAAISMMILSLKGFVLWIINVSFMIYLIVRALFIGHDNNGTGNLFMIRKDSDDILATRPPINAFQEEEQKPSVLSTVFANEGFEPDNRSPEPAVVINRDIIARAARLSTDISLQERRFRNLDNFQQYPPRSRPESMMPEQNQQQQNSPIVVAAFPAPDYTPPMQRAAHNPNRNQRYQ